MIQGEIRYQLFINLWSSISLSPPTNQRSSSWFELSWSTWSIIDPTISIIKLKKASRDALSDSKTIEQLLPDGACIVRWRYWLWYCCSWGVSTGNSTYTVHYSYGWRRWPCLSKMQCWPNRPYSEPGGLVIGGTLSGQGQNYDFPVGNRIISGLSRRTLLMQATIRSGAMLTANLALNQRRDVLVYDPERLILGLPGINIYWIKGFFISFFDDYICHLG